MEIRITTIIFDKGLRPEDVSAFRGAVLTILPDDKILHNHSEETVIYRYPKVQYKSIGDKACIVGIEEGAEILEREFAIGDELELMIGKKIRKFTVTGKRTSYFNPDSSSEDRFRYKIHDWLPLNQKNHIAYQKTMSLKERVAILDNILISNILAAHKKGMGHIIEHECIAFITDIISIKTAIHKGVEMLSLDVCICTNTPIPQYCGLGKGSARGHGTVFEM